MTIDELKSRNLLVFEAVSGSKAYGLDTPESDTDMKGVFVLPQSDFYGLEHVDQVNNPSNDLVYYGLRKFVDLLAKNNPNILELLGTPEDFILFKNPLFNRFKVNDFLSKQCLSSFAGYAITQIRKAKGLNKKIVNPVDKKRKSILDFCYVVFGQGAIPVKDFLQKEGLKQENCGLSSIPHMFELYGLYYSTENEYGGIVKKENSNEVSLSSIPKGKKPIATMSFNKSGYSVYCKEYKAYWDWVEKRNDARYQNTLSHGKNYDAKNMMHTFRLLAMAKEIGELGEIIVKRPDRDFLLKIKNGEFEYDELVKIAEEKVFELENIYKNSNLPDQPDINAINALLVDFRKDYYDLEK